MLTSEQIVSAFRSIGASSYETRFCFDEDIDVALKSGDLQELTSLVLENGIKSVFYGYEYADPDEYLICDSDVAFPDDDAEEQDAVYRDYLRRFQEEKRKFNARVSLTDFTKPVVLSVYCILNGIQVGILQNDSWTEELPDKSEILARLEDELNEQYEAAMERESAAIEKRHDEVVQKIKDYLDTTDEWHTCTNQRLRRNYCLGLIAQYEEQYGVRLSTYEISDALELKWNAYKAKRLK